MVDPYVYPGTTILRNKEHIQDAAELGRLEAELTANRMEHLPRELPLTYAGYREIHRHIFEPLYDWAGEARSVNIAKGDMFCLAPYIDAQMERRFAALKSENELKGLTADAFATRAAEHVAEINAIHPFREGNGRTQRAFLDLLSERAGHPLDLQRIQPAAWMDASIKSFKDADYEPMRQVIAGAMIGPTAQPSWPGVAEFKALPTLAEIRQPNADAEHTSSKAADLEPDEGLER